MEKADSRESLPGADTRDTVAQKAQQVQDQAAQACKWLPTLTGCGIVLIATGLAAREQAREDLAAYHTAVVSRLG